MSAPLAGSGHGTWSALRMRRSGKFKMVSRLASAAERFIVTAGSGAESVICGLVIVIFVEHADSTLTLSLPPTSSTMSQITYDAPTSSAVLASTSVRSTPSMASVFAPFEVLPTTMVFASSRVVKAKRCHLEPASHSLRTPPVRSAC
eukprot:6595884-Prymnesium_polylepis.1